MVQKVLLNSIIWLLLCSPKIGIKIPKKEFNFFFQNHKLFLQLFNWLVLRKKCIEFWFHYKFIKTIFSVFSRIRYCPHFVRLSVCLSVCLSVRLSVRRPHYYFSWGWPIGAIYGSIDSLWPKDPNNGRKFFWAGPGPDGRGLKSKFRIFSYKYCILFNNWY
jgi:hypothetical protein